MKRRTLRGQMVEGEVVRLVVDDGRLNHGYRITNFVVAGIPDSGSNDAYATLSLAEETPFTWNWGDNRQIAWASSGVSGVGDVRGPWTLVDPNHVVLQDLYIRSRVGGSGGTSFVNYLIEIEPMSMTDDESILQLIKERSQNVTN